MDARPAVPSRGAKLSAPGGTAPGRVRMWRGGLRSGLSVSAPFVWRCLTSRTITPFPHPPHRTGHAELPHPALGQDSMPLHTKGHTQFTRPPHRAVLPRRTSDRAICTQPPMPPPGWSFASRIAIRVLSSLQHVVPSAAAAHYRSFLGLPQSPVLCHFQRQS